MEVHPAAAADAIGLPSSSSSPSVGIPAPYGRACANCSRAKCRCIYRSHGDDCERCHRLNKECRPSIPVRRKAAASSAATKRSSSSTLSRTAQLEQKLDGLVSLLTAQASARARASEGTTATTRISTGTGTSTAAPGASLSNAGNDTRGSIASSQTSPINSHAASAIPEAGRSYIIPDSTPSGGPDEFRPLGQAGPDFGCGVAMHNHHQHHHQHRPALAGNASSLSSRAATTETRASSVSLQGGDVPLDDLQASTMMAAKCAGSHLPRTPESSTSSTAPSAGVYQQQNPQPQPQPQPQHKEDSQPQQALPGTVPQNIGWGFSCFTDASQPRDGTDGISFQDTLNLDPSLEPTPEEADRSLHTFRTTMLPYFPFVHLPPDLTAAQMRRSRPVLWLSILAITCQRVPTHTQLGRSTHLRALFAYRVVFESEKGLDLLQGLLAFLTWVHYTSKRDRPTLSVMSQLAVSMVYDLGLHKAASPCKSLIARLVRDHYQQSLAADDPPTLPPLMDERRAALATYMLTSKFSIALKRCEPLRWTPRLEEHLCELAAQAETPLDHVLAAQVRLQRLADHIHQGEWQLDEPTYLDAAATEQPGRPGTAANSENKLLPPYVLRVVRAKIEEIRDNIPPEARHYEGVLDALYAAEMVLSAGAVLPIVAPVASMASIAIISVRARSKPYVRADKPLDNPVHNKAASSANGGRPLTSAVDFSRVIALEQCVEAVAQFWSFFRQIKSTSYAGLPFSFFAHFTHCVVLLYGLSVIDEPNWDRAAVRDRLHVLDMLDGFIAKLRDAPRLGPSTAVAGPESYDVFNRAAIMLSSVRDLWAIDMGRPDHRDRTRTAAVATSSAVVTGDQQQGRETTMPFTAAAAAAAAAAPTTAAAPAMPPPLGQGPMTLDTTSSSAEGEVWQLPTVGAPPMADMAMGVPDSLTLPSNDEFFSELTSAVGLPEDYMFWEVFLDGLPQTQF
ncbi:hypothetical protein SCUCBS95973_005604 [Sporothrix curviconia]|uniref:Zn(2)-C6 fungal-type domain-containing protein n=1 Tax=Sporothrix curviconia TaxID=1260050 RepID=A0ABP0BYK6_9PEZI